MRHSILLLALLALLPGVHAFGSLQFLRAGGQVPGPYTATNTEDLAPSADNPSWGPYMQAEAMNLATGALADNLNLPSNRAM